MPQYLSSVDEYSGEEGKGMTSSSFSFFPLLSFFKEPIVSVLEKFITKVTAVSLETKQVKFL